MRYGLILTRSLPYRQLWCVAAESGAKLRMCQSFRGITLGKSQRPARSLPAGAVRAARSEKPIIQQNERLADNDP